MSIEIHACATPQAWLKTQRQWTRDCKMVYAKAQLDAAKQHLPADKAPAHIKFWRAVLDHMAH